MSATSSPEQSTGSTSDRPRVPSVARWGAACAPCATAKAKCLRSNSKPGSKCDSSISVLASRTVSSLRRERTFAENPWSGVTCRSKPEAPCEATMGEDASLGQLCIYDRMTLRASGRSMGQFTDVLVPFGA
ncbi:unnamed protein product [Colletotrichum noveboracense]|uniref:Uncharacterized protein n=1 Tax=Colletotrichum noveboracense TaxID=2664923 RepID=A0A9W4WJC5_9PEZI|nr:unnamed protein product [Colletotrichum noveboracense]